MDKKEFRKLVSDATLIGSWEDINAQPLSSITKNPEDTEILDGLVIRGYETKFAEGTNTNGERFTKDSIDKFIEEYFVEKKLNMPLDIEHNASPEWLAGRVIYIETNSVGFYYVAYIPKTYIHYDHVRSLLANKILQGFSKMGWATKGHWVEDKNDAVYGGYFLIEELEIVRMSLVSTPANGLPFEDVEESKVQDATRFRKAVEEEKEEDKVSNAFAAMFV